MERKGKGIKTKSDLHTYEMLEDIRERVADISDGALHVHTVSLKVHRKFIDANRGLDQKPYQITKDNCFGKAVYEMSSMGLRQRMARALRF